MTDGQFPPPASTPSTDPAAAPWWKKKRAKLPTWAWLVIGAVVAFGAIGALASPEEEADAEPQTTEPTDTAPAIEETATTDAPATTETPDTTEAATTTTESTTTTTTIPDPTISGGVYVVGTDIQPGVFRVGGYWARLDAAQEIIDNGLTDNCPNIMVVQPTDAYVEISGGALRIEDSFPIDPIAEGCTDGVFLVNLDVQPGRYSVTGGTGGSSYWARLDGTLDIIDNDLGEGTRIVIVDATDFALEINGTLTPMP
jgi:hypothetical protein